MLKIDHDELMGRLHGATENLLQELSMTTIKGISEGVICETRENVKYLLENTDDKGDK